MLTLKDDIHSLPAVKEKLWPKVVRGLRKEQKEGLRRSLLESMHSVDLFTQSGIYVETRSGYGVDESRLEKVTARTVKGLFYHLSGRRLPNTCVVRVICESRLNSMPKAKREQMLAIALATWQSEGCERTLGDGVFSYRTAFLPEDQNASAMLLNFFRRLSFIGITLSSKNAPTQHRSRVV